jgi:hypothetical protein
MDSEVSPRRSPPLRYAPTRTSARLPRYHQAARFAGEELAEMTYFAAQTWCSPTPATLTSPPTASS